MFKHLRLCLLLALALSGSSTSFAAKCIGYVSVDGGDFMCAGWEDTSPCEESPSRCIPIPPRNPNPPHSSDTSPGPSGGGRGEFLSPEEMSCEQLNSQSGKQLNIILQLKAALALVEAEIGVGDRALSHELSGASISLLQINADYSCDRWSDLRPEEICTDYGFKPPRCVLPKLSTAQEDAMKECESLREALLIRRREQRNWIAAQESNTTRLSMLQRRLRIARANLDKLSRAISGKPGKCP